MNLIDQLSGLSWEDIEYILHQYEGLGPLPGIFGAFLESFLPILPLIAIIVANVNAYGLWEGAVYSWFGVVGGATCVFLLVRKFGGRFRGFIESRYPKSNKFIHWVETHGFTPIFILACFPFTPSAFINIVAGISKLPTRVFLIATAMGKAVMILLVSIAGHDLGNLLEQPWKIVTIVVLLALIWLMGRKLESRYTR
ncbi:TVP38/TMEM64 family protein [Paenibacillus xerothermodurans]|uniref:TVP38/TMEM64 family membrane protein n=1 Tax=Paenibacillus xerothermodurans TaxID=1977292 RepID=A0A2W1NQF9_PAEXE|nr:TVP38/TMEM64 family protein [Paenibacillus xerothermodurans]PZE21715.1 TVP38/TMEM64 family protein [Paenibacillus xerothermodurans]